MFKKYLASNWKWLIPLVLLCVPACVILWRLLLFDDNESKLGEIALLLGLLLAIVVTGIVNITFHVYAIDEEVRAHSVQLSKEGRLIEISDSSEYLQRLMHQMTTNCEQFCYLMFFFERPQLHQTSTSKYWDNYFKFVTSGATDAKFRRIASVDEWSKFEFILEMNKRVIKLAKKSKRVIRYQLAIYPFAAIKPPQIDIVDDSVFLFSPYKEELSVLKEMSKVMTSEKHMVLNLQHYYENLWATLASANLVLLNLDELDSGTKEGYSLDEIKNVISIFKLFERNGTVRLDCDLYGEFIEGQSEVSRQEFNRLFSETAVENYFERITGSLVVKS